MELVSRYTATKSDSVFCFSLCIRLCSAAAAGVIKQHSVHSSSSVCLCACARARTLAGIAVWRSAPVPPCPFSCPPALKWTSWWAGIGGRRCLVSASPDGLSSPCAACQITSSTPKKKECGGWGGLSKQQRTAYNSAPVKHTRTRERRERGSEHGSIRPGKA